MEMDGDVIIKEEKIEIICGNNESNESNTGVKSDKLNQDADINQVQSTESVEPSIQLNEDVTGSSEINLNNDFVSSTAVKTPGRKRGRKKKVKLYNDDDPDIIQAQCTKSIEPSNEQNEDIIESSEINPNSDFVSTPEVKTPGRRGRKKKLYNDDDDPDTIKEKKKKRAIELKLRSLKCSFNETTEVSGKRLKKPPQRFELQPSEKRKSSVDDGKGRGEFLGDIRWINHQLRAASLYTLRLLHRVIYRKQGMFAEKHIIKSVMKFNGFPFDASHPELKRRREQLERFPTNGLQQLCHLLGLRRGNNDEMMDRIINFLLCPSQKEIEAYITDVMDKQLQHAKPAIPKPFESPFQKIEPSPPIVVVNNYQQKSDFNQFQMQEDSELSHLPQFSSPVSKVDLDASWIKPVFFIEGSGVKLKYIRAVITNIESASDAFIELLHRLLFLDVDEKSKMRRNILEFSGLKCEVGTPNYVYRVRILSVLPMEQLKLICRILCLPTWHRSRQYLTDAIMDFLSIPRVSAMKKRVPPVFSEEISFSFDNAKANQARIPELKSAETEEIEIVPDIHIPDETSSHLGSDCHMENEYLGVKLKNFSNIHYQVISTPAVKLNDVHMILYLTPSAQNNIRKNILEFSGFPFDENFLEYQNRRTLMEQMSVEDLKTVATVLCVSQYICDDSKKSLIDAILKFLLKPSALLSSSTIMPTISQTPVNRIANPPIVIKKNATSTTITSNINKPYVIKSETAISSVDKCKSNNKDSVKLIIDALSSSGKNESETDTEIEMVKACLSKSSIVITPVPPIKIEKDLSPSKVVDPPKVLINQPVIKKEPNTNSCEADELLSDVKKEVSTVAPRIQYFGSDDEDDQPLSKMIGHPNDDQLRALVSKIIKESKLEDITMKHVIRKVFETYPNYDLNYRKEFIKSNVRLILSQMDDQSCSVSTTVINI